MKIYTQKKTNDIIFEEDMQDYALEQLRIKIEPKGTNGEYELEQLEMIEMIMEYFYSDWVETEYEVEEEE